ncbi:hypothetical protein V8E52_010602 [Russula decolorans]
MIQILSVCVLLFSLGATLAALRHQPSRLVHHAKTNIQQSLDQYPDSVQEWKRTLDVSLLALFMTRIPKFIYSNVMLSQWEIQKTYNERTPAELCRSPIRMLAVRSVKVLRTTVPESVSAQHSSYMQNSKLRSMHNRRHKYVQFYEMSWSRVSGTRRWLFVEAIVQVHEVRRCASNNVAKKSRSSRQRLRTLALLASSEDNSLSRLGITMNVTQRNH